MHRHFGDLIHNLWSISRKSNQELRSTKMKTVMARLGLSWLAAVFAIAITYSGLVSANPIGVSPVNFTNGQGTLTGTFQTDASGNVTTWDLTTSEFDCNPCGLSTGFPGFTYNASTSTTTTGFSFGNQTIQFTSNDTAWQLDFVLDCGGNSTNCIANAAIGDNIALNSAFEMGMPDFLPFRSLDLGHLSVTDPPVGLSFNLIAGSPGGGGKLPEPSTLLLLSAAGAGLLGFRKKSTSHPA